MKVIILGLGSIGKAHLKSFFLTKLKYEIFLYDKKKINLQFLKNCKKKNIKLKILKKFPYDMKFDLCIVSTNSLERYLVIKKMIKQNKIKHLIIEKFIFTKEDHFRNIKKVLSNNSSNIFINVWGSIILNLLNVKTTNLKSKVFFKVDVKEGGLLTNLIHYLDMFCYLTEKKVDLEVFINKKFNSKRKKYTEIQGEFFCRNKYGEMIVKSNKKILCDEVNILIGSKKYQIDIAKNKNCYLYKNSKLIKVIKFPYASLQTSKIFENYLLKGKKEKIYSNFKFIFKLSKKVIETLHNIDDKIYIT